MKKKSKKSQNYSHENLEQNLYLRILKFGIKHSKGFTCSKILGNRELGLKVGEKSIVEKYLHSAYINSRETKAHNRSGNTETPFLLIGHPLGSEYASDLNKYTITFDAQFKYVDYLELKSAREHATQAKIFSLLAIKIAAITLTVSIIGIGGSFYFQNQSIQSSNKNLQIAVDPQITIYPQNKPESHFTTFIQTDSSVFQFVLKNKFMGTLDNVEIYKDYILMAQDIYNFDIWTCSYDINISPISTTTALSSGKEYDFSFDYFGAYQQSQFYRKNIKEYTNSVSFIRIRIDFEKKESSEPFSRYFFYRVSDDTELWNYNDRSLATDISNRYGTLEGQAIIDLIQQSDPTSIDKRCFL